MSKWKKALWALLALFFIIILWNHELVIYGIRQLRGQLNIISNAVSVDELKYDEQTDSVTLAKLAYIDEVRRFAVDSLGLDNTDNYTTYYNQNKKPVMWVVTGSLPYEFKEKTWWFPFINTVSYKGFFDERLALQEAANIESEGYESDIYSPEAWSTLGFFTDPVLSNMLNRGHGKLAELIIHELAHATVFLPSEVDLNENLATLAGEFGAMRFLQYKYGAQSKEYLRYANRLKDDQVYYRHMMQGYARLDSLYSSFKPNDEVAYKAGKKYALIAEILLEINKLPLNDLKRYRYDFEKGKLPGNPDFIAFSRYRGGLEKLDSVLIFRYQQNIGKMLREIQSKGKIAAELNHPK
ncbi:MAG: aminopeptidase [Bacteroidota bacterium]